MNALMNSTAEATTTETAPVGGCIFVRPIDVQNATGMARSTLYAKIDDGLFPPPVKLGARFACWPDTELETWMQARIAGHSDEDIRALVVEIVKARKQGCTA
ncbi:MAG: AlpA family phage regulatory protein [Paracoccaceae bacterium]